MKSSLLIFYSIFFGIYFLINFYIFTRGYQAISSFGNSRYVLAIIFWIFVSAYFLSRFFERSGLNGFHHILYWVGSAWFALMLYFFLAVVLVDLTRVFNTIFHYLPDKESVLYPKIKIFSLSGFLFITLILISYGVWNAFHPIQKKLELTINKNAGERKELSLVMVSDIHMGSLFGKSQIEKMVHDINALHPDIVLFVGDILDEVQDPIIRDNIGDPIKNLKAPLGIYGITGNHEYIGGIAKSVKYIESLGINLIRDTSVLIDNSFWFAGREDRDINRFTKTERKPLQEVLSGVNHEQPIILMDHQPFALDISEKEGVDLQLSGHTHHGQMWPLNYITQKVYEVSWGYKQKGNMHVYVSCGYGFWGPQVRIGNRPEMVNIKLKFL